MRNLLRTTVLVLATLLGALVLTAPAQAGTPYCGITWGSTPEVQRNNSGADDHVVDVRAGRHACYDRLVIELGGAPGYRGYDVRYVPSVHEEAEGSAIPLRGGAKLQVVVFSENHDADGNLTYRPYPRHDLLAVGGFRTFRQVAWAGSFEGQTTVGVGTRARLPFRTFVLSGPHPGSTRLVLDVAHRW